MFSEVKKMLVELDENNPNWEEIAETWLETDQDEDMLAEEEQQLIERLKRALTKASDIAMQKDASDEQINELFQGRSIASFATGFVIRKLNHYRKFDYLRKTEKTNPYQAQAVIDIIWEQYVIRVNPQIRFDPSFPVDEATYKDIAMELDDFADFCAARQLHVLTIREQLKSTSGLSDELCEYVSRKIDQDFEKLKLNYLINQQTRQNELLVEVRNSLRKIEKEKLPLR